MYRVSVIIKRDDFLGRTLYFLNQGYSNLKTYDNILLRIYWLVFGPHKKIIIIITILLNAHLAWWPAGKL